jgi:hypothetical protein
MHTGEKAQRHRNQRLIGVDRVDQQQNFQFTPEQQESSSQITFEGLDIKTPQGGHSIPLRTSMEYYFLVSTQWLHGLIAGREGCFDPTYPFFAFHKRGLEAVMVRVFFLLDTTDMLSHKRATPLPWDIIWRYLLRIAADFKSAPLSDVGMDGDILQYIEDYGTPNIEVRACPRMAALAKKRFSEYAAEGVRLCFSACSRLWEAAWPGHPQGRQHQGRRRFLLCSLRKIQLREVPGAQLCVQEQDYGGVQRLRQSRVQSTHARTCRPARIGEWEIHIMR